MGADRLNHSLEHGGLTLPSEGPLALFGADDVMLLQALPQDRCHVITSMRNTHDLFSGRTSCDRVPNGPYTAAIVTLPRARDQSRDMIAQAARHTPGGIVIVDGQKTNGAEAMLKAVRARVPLLGQVSKAHGKLFWFEASDAFEDWASAGPAKNRDDYFTAPGVFSADGIDPASLALIDALPEKLGRHVLDLGGGWGYLSRNILKRDTVERLDLVEIDHTALDCAALNVDDPRAQLHWADATRWTPDVKVDTVVMNPPFHTGRKGDPGLGQAFITAAAKMLKSNGQLIMVANRHLPYETTLEQKFARLTDLGGGTKFKILHAEKPKNSRR